MKRCPECRRDYFDETLLYCLDDGTRLLEGPSASDAETIQMAFGSTMSEADTRDLPEARASLPGAPEPSRSRRGVVPLVALGVALIGFAAWYMISQNVSPQPAAVAVPPPSDGAEKLYWDMSDSERTAFTAERSKHVQKLIGGSVDELDADSVSAIRAELDEYAERRTSLSQEPFEEGLRAVYGRATQLVPVVGRSFEANRVPRALGIYQAMVESEYHDCPEPEGLVEGKPPIGLFQFSRKTASMYGLKPEDYCDVTKQSDAAARHMSDLASDFGSDGDGWTLALLSFFQGGNRVREQLRELRARGITRRSFWAIYGQRSELKVPLDEGSSRYVPRFFAAAIIGETPAAFDLPTPPLSSLDR